MDSNDKEEFEKKLFTIFFCIGVMNYEKCQEILERERRNSFSSKPLQVRQLYIFLLNLIEGEKSYNNLGFMYPRKIFLRKDNSLKSMYESMKLDLNKIEPNNLPDETVDIIVVQLIQYITARIQLMELYEKIYILGTSTKHIRYEELLSQIELIIESNTFSFLHPILKQIRSTIINECGVLIHLFGAHVELQNWNFFPSIMHVHTAHNKLTNWEKSLQCKEAWKLGFLKGSHLPLLFQWLLRFKAAVINKFTLYFFQVLSQQTPFQEMKNYISPKHNTDFFLKLQSLQKKIVASSVLLLFDPSDLDGWAGPGFQHHSRRKEELSSQYLVMVSHPPTKSEDCMVGISKALKEKTPDYALPLKVVSVYKVEDNCSYFISSIDPRITVVAIFDIKKDEKDPNVVNYMNEFCSQVRFTRLYQSLKVAK